MVCQTTPPLSHQALSATLTALCGVSWPLQVLSMADRLHLLAQLGLAPAGTPVVCKSCRHSCYPTAQGYGCLAALPPSCSHSAVWAVCPALLWLDVHLFWAPAEADPSSSQLRWPLTCAAYRCKESSLDAAQQALPSHAQLHNFPSWGKVRHLALCRSQRGLTEPFCVPVEATRWQLGYPDLDRAIVVGQAVVRAGQEKGADASLRNLKRLRSRLEAHGLTMVFIEGDGDCLGRKSCGRPVGKVCSSEAQLYVQQYAGAICFNECGHAGRPGRCSQGF